MLHIPVVKNGYTTTACCEVAMIYHICYEYMFTYNCNTSMGGHILAMNRNNLV